MERGYLYSKGSNSEQLKLERAWRRACYKEDRPYVVGWKRFSSHPKKLMGSLYVELTGAWGLSQGVAEALRREFEPDFEIFFRGNTATLPDFPHGLQDILARRLLDCLDKHRNPEEVFGRTARLVRGLARCVYVEGLEHCLVSGALYYVREIPNMRGHVVALTSGANPVVGVHLERFELL